MPKSVDECRAVARGRVWSVEVEGDEGKHTIVFRKPTAAEWRKYQSAIATAKVAERGEVLVDAQEEIVVCCCVSHSPEELTRLADDVLGLWLEVGAEIAKVAGRDSTSAAKKHEPGSARP